MADYDAFLCLQSYALLTKHKAIGQPGERRGLRNVHVCLTTFDLTESPLQGTHQVATVAIGPSIPTRASAHWDGSGISTLLGYRETILLQFSVASCAA